LTAMNAKRSRLRRQRHQPHAEPGGSTRLLTQPGSPTVDEAALREMQALLDEEVARLPRKYREPFILCCLEGRSRSETAAELGWKLGTVSSPIAQARRLLQERLTRRGVTLSAALTAGVLWEQPVSAALVQPTLQAAMHIATGQAVGDVVAPSVAALVQASVRTMLSAKAKLAIALLLAVSLIGGIGFAIEPQPVEEPVAQAAESKIESREPKTDRFGDPLPPGAIARLGTIRWRLDAHHAEALAISPGSKSLVAINAIKGITVFDTTTGKAVRQIPDKPERRKEWLAQDWWAPSALSADGQTAALIPSADAIHLI